MTLRASDSNSKCELSYNGFLHPMVFDFTSVDKESAVDEIEELKSWECLKLCMTFRSNSQGVIDVLGETQMDIMLANTDNYDAVVPIFMPWSNSLYGRLQSYYLLTQNFREFSTTHKYINAKFDKTSNLNTMINQPTCIIGSIKVKVSVTKTIFLKQDSGLVV